MSEPLDPISEIQKIIDGEHDISQAPPYVRGMDLTAVRFNSVSLGRFDMEWDVEQHLTHYDGIVQGGVVNVVADMGQSFAFGTTSKGPETFSTAEFTTRFFRPIMTGQMIDVVSEVVNRSRRLGVVESKFTNRETRKLCAVVTGAWMVVQRDFSSGQA